MVSLINMHGDSLLAAFAASVMFAILRRHPLNACFSSGKHLKFDI